jgi:hypothetical protein
MVQVACEVTAGLRDTERTVAVRDIKGRRQFLRVERGFLSSTSGQSFLPVGIVALDEKKQLALIELPHESDAGVNRLWVSVNQLQGLREPVA